MAGQPARRQLRAAALAFAAPIIVFVALAVYGSVQSRRADDARALATRTLRLQGLTQDLALASASMELHQRGYLLTGAPAALAARDAAFEEGAVAGRALLEAVDDHADSARLARRVQAEFRRRYSGMRSAGDVVEREGLEAGRARFLRAGSASADTMLGALGALQRQQQARLRESLRMADAQARDFRTILVYGTVAALVLLILSAVMLYRQLRRAERLGRELANAHAEQAARAVELERSNKELEAFSYTISHDLRAPLRHIDGYAQMLQEDAADQLTPDMQRYLDTISDSSRKMGALIDDLLAFSRLGRKPVERVPCDMSQLVAHVLRDLHVERSDAEVVVGELPDVHADPVLMRQVWVNLVSNALKYSRGRGAGARVEIGGERDGAIARYRIRDNGVGFDMRYADKLFGVFQRLHADEEFEGTGVGLAIVQQIVHRHGGRIEADATPGEGACFTFELPGENG